MLQIWHLHVEYDQINDRLVYHRTLKKGSGSSLYGLEVAKAMRIPSDILEDAIRFRKQIAGEADLNKSVVAQVVAAVTLVLRVRLALKVQLVPRVRLDRKALRVLKVLQVLLARLLHHKLRPGK